MSDVREGNMIRDCVFYLLVFLLIVLFAGEPDLMDAIIHYLMK